MANVNIKGGWGDSHLGTNGDMINTHLESGKWTYGGAIPFCCGKNNISDFDIVIDLSGNSTTCDSDDSGKCCEPLTFTSTDNVCEDEWLVTWFSGGTNLDFDVLNDSKILKVKNVDDCTKSITLNKKDEENYTNYPYRFSSAQTFEQTTYVDCGDPTLISCVTYVDASCVEKYNTSGTNLGHKIKYKPISNTIPTSFIVNNSGLTEIYFPSQYNENGDNEYKNTSIIGAGACSGNTNLTAITLGKTVTIQREAFKGSTNLKIVDWGYCNRNSVKLENDKCNERSHASSHLRYIGESAFSGCCSLKYVNLPDGLETIGASAFASASTSTGRGVLRIPISVNEIGQNAFENADFQFVCWGVNEDTDVTNINQFNLKQAYDLFLPNLNVNNACITYNKISNIISGCDKIYVRSEDIKTELAKCCSNTIEVLNENWPYIDVQGDCY